MAAKKKKFLKGVVKHPGALDREVGGKASQNLEKVRHLAEHGTPEQKKRANLYLKVLRPMNQRRGKRA